MDDFDSLKAWGEDRRTGRNPEGDVLVRAGQSAAMEQVKLSPPLMFYLKENRV